MGGHTGGHTGGHMGGSYQLHLVTENTFTNFCYPYSLFYRPDLIVSASVLTIIDQV